MANEIVTRAGIAGIGYQLFCSNNVIVGLSLGSICFREQILVPSRIPHFSLKSEPRCSLWSPKTLIADLLDLLKSLSVSNCKPYKSVHLHLLLNPLQSAWSGKLKLSPLKQG